PLGAGGGRGADRVVAARGERGDPAPAGRRAHRVHAVPQRRLRERTGPRTRPGLGPRRSTDLPLRDRVGARAGRVATDLRRPPEVTAVPTGARVATSRGTRRRRAS